MYNFRSITLNITQGCNLRCKYCQVKKDPQVMTKETLDEALTWVEKNVKHPFISFFGGEPLTQFNLIKYGVENHPDIKYGVSTNLTLMDKEKIKYFFDKKFRFLFSIDGVGEVHNETRDNSWTLIKNKLPIVAELFPGAIFRITITSKNVSHLYETVRYAAALGFTSINALPDGMDESWGIKDYWVLKEQLTLLFQDSFLYKVFRPFHEYQYRLDHPSSAFTCCDGKTTISILTDGRFSLCGEQTEDSPFIVGDLKTGISTEKIQKFWEQYTPCPTECIAKPICNKERCFSRRWFCYGNLSARINSHCQWYRCIAEVIKNGQI